MESYFNQLPKELLIETFVHVNENDIKNLIVISPFDSMITSRKNWMEIFRLAFPDIDAFEALNIRDDLYVYLNSYLAAKNSYYMLDHIEDGFTIDSWDYRGNSIIEKRSIMNMFLPQFRHILHDEELKKLVYRKYSDSISFTLRFTDKYYIHILLNVDNGMQRLNEISKYIDIPEKLFKTLVFLRYYCI